VILINGISTAAISLNDRGLNYGDGVFETLAVVDNRPQHWERHLHRLRDGAHRLGISPPSDLDWWADFRSLQKLHAPSPRSVLKLMLTRGEGGRGYAPPVTPQPTRIVRLLEWPTWPATLADTGVRVAICRTRLGRNPALAGIKHLNRLEQVLASAEIAALEGIQDGIMLDVENNVIESTKANLFVVKNGGLLTPQLHHAGICGVMRELILEEARRSGLPVFETSMCLSAVSEADEAFLCNSLIGIWPIRTIESTERYHFEIGPITQWLQQALKKGDWTP
jgi:4-amino-4-deoxychorismate lyase